MKLAYVIITLTSPPQFAGEEFITTQPEPCAVTMDEIIENFEAAGFTADGRCDYTFAPAESVRPQPRRTK